MTDEGTQRVGQTSATPTIQLENIKVAVRLRPFTEKEKQKNNRRIVDIEQNTIALYNPRYSDNLKKFTFDYSYWSHDGFKKDENKVNVPDPNHPNCGKYVGQEKVFEDLGQFLLVNALEGYDSALLAYGQTGSGKSYTVSGYGQNEGILPRFARALFVKLEKKQQSMSALNEPEKNSSNPGETDKAPESSNYRYEVFFSMIEIYNEVVRDLLAKSHAGIATNSIKARRGLKVREHPKLGFFVENLTSYACTDKKEIEQRIEEGHLNKSIAATSMNETSSRGHTIYEFKINQYKLKSSDNPEETLTKSVVQLVDLAGSERMAVHVNGKVDSDSSSSRTIHSRGGHEKASSSLRSKGAHSSASSANSMPSMHNSKLKGATKNTMHLYESHQQRFKESISINQSLSALGNCIQVMSQFSQQFDPTNPLKKSSQKIPYRDSVLTKLLNRCCLSGNSKLAIIATLSPADTNYDDTLSTLRFSDRAKQIRTHATINQLRRNTSIDHRHLKHLKDGCITRSDDSSQTSNFDDNESAMENFTGSKIRRSNKSSNNIDVVATPLRSRTTTRKDRQNGRKGEVKSSKTASNPTLGVREEMKRLVSPASKKLNDTGESKSLRKSRSMALGLADKHHEDFSTSTNEFNELELDDDLNDLADIQEGLISPDSDDSYIALANEDLSNDEKIKIFNRLLSNSTINIDKNRRTTKRSTLNNKTSKLRKTNKSQAGTKQVSMVSNTLKKSNPYLSNLNPDEQLTGMITYIIKQAETTVGKSNDCDIVLRGPEIRGQHAKITRLDSAGQKNETNVTKSVVFIEPVLSTPGEDSGKRISLMVNGSPVIERVQLNHCDRILFGTNAYFMFVDNLNADKFTGSDLNSVTYDMAQNEVTKNVMAEAKNEGVIKEIKDYTHRPGTGKHRTRDGDISQKSGPKSDPLSKSKSTKLRRTITIPDRSNATGSYTENSKDHESSVESDIVRDNSSAAMHPDFKVDQDQETLYRDRLMEDTYEYAMPVAEVNAVAKEMSIKVRYELKILTGEEQLQDSSPSNFASSSTSDSSSSSSIRDSANAEGEHAKTNDQADLVTQLTKLDFLDIPPEVYVKVHLEEQDIDFYWAKEKFQARRYKILELYELWDASGKSGLVEYLIEQSKTPGIYLIDPFVDDPSSTFVLIGHSQINLQPVAHLTDVKQSYDILDLNDEIVGNVNIEAVPCYETSSRAAPPGGEPFIRYKEEDLRKKFLQNTKDLLGNSLIFMLKIISCNDVPLKYTNVFCQYTLKNENPSVKTKILREDSQESDRTSDNLSELRFNHTHYIRFEKVDQDMLDFFEHGFLTIQVIGQYKLSKGVNKSPTLVSTIINSINKYKFKMEQQPYSSSTNYSNYSNSANSNRGPSRTVNSNSGASSVASTSATANLFDQQNDDDEGINSMGGPSQENIIDMILTKRKLDRAENQLHYLKRTVNIAEHYNKKHIPVKIVKKLLNSQGQELDSGSLEEMSSDGFSSNTSCADSTSKPQRKQTARKSTAAKHEMKSPTNIQVRKREPTPPLSPMPLDSAFNSSFEGSSGSFPPSPPPSPDLAPCVPSTSGVSMVSVRNPLEKRCRMLSADIESRSARIRAGVGIGKGGLKRMAAIMKKNRRRKTRRDGLRGLHSLQRRKIDQNSIPRMPFQRLIKEILNQVARQRNMPICIRINFGALHSLRDAAEAFLTRLFETGSLFTIHAKRVTFMSRDMDLAKKFLSDILSQLPHTRTV